MNDSPVLKTTQELMVDEAEFFATKQKFTAEKAALQGQLAEINFKCTVRLPTKEYHKLQGQRGQIVRQLRKLVELRDKWHGFSMDAANPQKARETAWRFSQELRDILKVYFDGGKDE